MAAEMGLLIFARGCDGKSEPVFAWPHHLNVVAIMRPVVRDHGHELALPGLIAVELRQFVIDREIGNPIALREAVLVVLGRDAGRSLSRGASRRADPFRSAADKRRQSPSRFF